MTVLMTSVEDLELVMTAQDASPAWTSTSHHAMVTLSGAPVELWHGACRLRWMGRLCLGRPM